MTNVADDGLAPARPGRRARRLVTVLLAILVAMGAGTGCASAPASDPDSTIPVSDTADAVPIDQTIPPDYLPPPGQCRAWRPGEAPDDQARAHPVGRCSELRRVLPEDVWLIYRPPDASGIVRVWRYGKEGGVVSQRIHDAATGALLRHVAPAGS